MIKEQKREITKISKQFASGFKEMMPTVNGTGWLIVDPLSAFLNVCGFENEIIEIKKTDDRPQVLIMVFKDGAAFIPAGGDLDGVSPKAKNWMWIDAPKIEKGG